MLAQKQPPLKECVIAHWSRGTAPKINGAKAQNRSGGLIKSGRGAFKLRTKVDRKDGWTNLK